MATVSFGVERTCTGLRLIDSCVHRMRGKMMDRKGCKNQEVLSKSPYRKI